MYARGLGVEQDYPKAMFWYKRAADNCNDEGILAIGDF
ncbi:MAG: SEL1-like repeat protein [Candidatus Obscuribacterales bacterium]|nr:SEL1-like repeat protein [Candidatus Obscuribacterales bacterium]